MLDTLDSVELVEWQEYAELEPFGPLQEDLRAAIPSAILANQWRTKGSVAPEDLFPSLQDAMASQETQGFWDSPEGQVAIARMYAGA